MLLVPRSRISFLRFLYSTMQLLGRIYRLFFDWFEFLHHVSKCTIISFTISPQKNKYIVVTCDCPCDDLVEVKAPPRSVMALTYIAQALVVTIVGLNMGFRYARHCMCIFHCECIKINYACILKRETRQNNRDIWKKILLLKKYQASTAPQQPVVLPHHEPNSGLAETKKASEGEMNCRGSSLPFVLPHCTHE
jgi:hypothetical protein